MAKFWKTGPKQEKKVRKKRVKFEKVRAQSTKRVARRAAQSAKRLEKIRDEQRRICYCRSVWE